MSKRLAEKGLKLNMTDEAKEFLIKKGSNKEYGARPLRRAIEQLLEDPMAEDLLRGFSFCSIKSPRRDGSTSSRCFARGDKS